MLALLVSLQTVQTLRRQRRYRRIDRKSLMFSQRTKEHFDVERIHTWFRNHKSEKTGGGEEGEVGSESKR
jgi:hypothetical protein